MAIEIIAARAENLAPAQIAAQLDARLGALVEGPRDLPPHQRTLRAAIRWSYDRLTPAEQRSFAQLGVFAGGFSPDDAQAVLNDGAAVAQMLESLHDMSLTHLNEAQNGVSRYGMLETIREFALEQLDLSGTAVAVRDAHAAHFEQVAIATRDKPGSDQQPAWYRRLTADLDNIRAALQWSAKRECWLRVLHIASELYHFWWQRGVAGEGLRWLELSLAQCTDCAPSLRAEAAVRAGILSYQCDDYAKSHTLLQEALAGARAAGQPRPVRGALANLGNPALIQGDFDLVERYLTESIDISHSIGDAAYTRFPLTVLGDLRYRQGQFELARDAYALAFTINTTCNDDEGIADSKWGLARCARGLGDLAGAADYCDDAHKDYERLDHALGIGWVLNVRANIAHASGSLAKALPLFSEALAIRLKHGDAQGGTRVLDETARVVSELHHFEIAVQLTSAAHHVRESLGGRMTGFEGALRAEVLERCRGGLGEPEFSGAWSRGAALALTDTLSLVKLLGTAKAIA